jgi:hypothetical protein
MRRYGSMIIMGFTGKDNKMYDEYLYENLLYADETLVPQVFH